MTFPYIIIAKIMTFPYIFMAKIMTFPYSFVLISKKKGSSEELPLIVRLYPLLEDFTHDCTTLLVECKSFLSICCCLCEEIISFAWVSLIK